MTEHKADAVLAAILALCDYAQHHLWCESRGCLYCPGTSDNYLHHNTENFYFHTFTAKACDCGLDATLALLPDLRAALAPPPLHEFVEQIANYQHKIELFNPIILWGYQHLPTDLAIALEHELCDATNEQATRAGAALAVALPRAGLVSYAAVVDLVEAHVAVGQREPLLAAIDRLAFDSFAVAPSQEPTDAETQALSQVSRAAVLDESAMHQHAVPGWDMEIAGGALTPPRCEGCEKGLPVMMLDDDGVLTHLSKRPGVPSHAVEDAWWPCSKWQLVQGGAIPALSGFPTPEQCAAFVETEITRQTRAGWMPSKSLTAWMRSWPQLMRDGNRGAGPEPAESHSTEAGGAVAPAPLEPR